MGAGNFVALFPHWFVNCRFRLRVRITAAWRTGITWKQPHRHNGKQQTKYCRSSDGMWKLSCRSISIARTQICRNQAPGNRAFNGEFTSQQPAQILPRNSRELEKAVAENTNLNFMAETCHPGRCSRRSFGSPQLSRPPAFKAPFFPVDFL